MPRTYYLIYSHSKAARMGRQPRPRHPPPKVLSWPSRGPKGMQQDWHPTHAACLNLGRMPTL